MSRRLGLLVRMLILAAAIIFVIAYASPYAPVVQPIRDIEEIWAIEDARQESEQPLITALENNGMALGYDAYENTFYCTLGLENTDAWPSIHLTAPGAGDVEICFVDDYTYDWCADAVREGYAYQIIAYNDEAFSYAQIVFTGMPILQITTPEEIPAHQDIPVQVIWNFDADQGLASNARVHKRGGGLLYYDNPKQGYKVEFTRRADGTGKMEMPAGSMGMVDEVILIPGAYDVMMMHDRLCWDLYGMLRGEEEPFGKQNMCYTEVFVNDAYHGVYLALEPFDYEEELNKKSRTAVETDSLYRTIHYVEDGYHERPVYQDETGVYYEVYYSNQPPERQFDVLQEYADILLCAEEGSAYNDEVFCDAVLNQMDLENFIEYFLFVQGCGLVDNVENNMYIWAQHEDGKRTYRFIPWDLDLSWDVDDENYENVKWIRMPLLERAIALDCGGVIRSMVLEVWKELRATVFHNEMIEKLTAQYAYELQESGAFYRDAIRWNKAVSYPDGFNIRDCANLRFEMLDRRIEEMASEALRGRLLEIGEYETIDTGELKSAPAQ